MSRTNEEIARECAERLMQVGAVDNVERHILAALNEATAERDQEIATLKAQLRERTQFICQCGGTKL
jgi:hypothetical protein